MAAPRIVVTGAGCVSPLGLTAADTWAAMREGRDGIAPNAQPFADQLRIRVAAEIKGWDASRWFDEKQLMLLDPFAQYALVAAREAVAQAGLPGLRSNEALAQRTAVVIGNGIGGETTSDAASKRFYGENNPRVHPFAIVRVMGNAPASQIAIEFGAMGPTFGVVSACASSNHAIAQAALLLRAGVADVALAGGTEACLSLRSIKAWEAMRVLADDTCRPFSRGRRGLVLGEGAGVFVLETLEHARSRGAVILAEYGGAGMSADAADIVQPDAAGAARAMRAALADAGLAPDDIDYVNAHGTGTPANDPTETRAIRSAFGAQADRLLVSSTKSMHGHALGAAGALELVAVLGALRDGVVPPTIHYGEPDPECDLDVVPNTARERPVRAALSNSFAFGGLNAVLAFKRWDG